MRFLNLLASFCLASILVAPASAAVLPATPATLSAVQLAAQPLDVIELAPGRYDVLAVLKKADLIIRGPRDAVFRTGSVSTSTNVTLEGMSFEWTPRAGDDTKTNVIRIYNSKGVRLSSLRLAGQPVPAGTPNALLANAVPAPPMNAFLVDYYAGRAISVEFSAGVVVRKSEISGFFSGISLGNSSEVAILENHIHHLRTTPIKGGGSGIVVDRNILEHMTPYRYVDPVTGGALGDHLDFIHFFTSLSKPILGLVITGNLMDASEGFDAIGVLLEDRYAAGIPNAKIADNTLLTGNNQGISLSAGMTGTAVTGNVLLGPPGSDKVPTLVHRGSQLAATGNTWADSAVKPYNSTLFPDNVYLPRSPATADQVSNARLTALLRIDPAPVDPRDAKIADLQDQVAALKAQVVNLEAQLAASRAQVSTLTGERDAAASAAAAAQAKIEAAKAALN